jgi:glycyl-tRNA synthetase beta chain
VIIRKRNAKPRTEPLLVELLTEELPPRLVPRWQDFAVLLRDGLVEAELCEADVEATPYVTPRRVAALIARVLDRQPDRWTEIKGPPVKVIYGPDGKLVEKVAEGFARKCGVSVSKLKSGLKTVEDPRGAYVTYGFNRTGRTLAALLPGIVERALSALPVHKRMRWGAGEEEFVRPVHGLIMLHGTKVVPGRVLNLPAGNRTRGHRFLGKDVVLRSAADYEKLLAQRGKVAASYPQRRESIARALDRAVAKMDKGATWRIEGAEAVLDEVAAMVEAPQVQVGTFDKAFLEVPRECLVVSMQQHQRYFPVAGARGRLLPKFLFVANVPARAGGVVVRGNERVLRARLSDARFFYDQDRRTPLAKRVEGLASVVHHNRLGSQRDRVERLRALVRWMAPQAGADADVVDRAALLCKADLLTGMVGEFPELQGIMGRYYALHDGEPGAVAEAIGSHYRPRFAGDDIPADLPGALLSLADRFDALAGFFGIGEVPSGDKDPFGLRRAAIGVVRILSGHELPLPLDGLVRQALAGYGDRVRDAQADVENFVLDRLAAHLREQGYTALQVDAVVSLRPMRLDLVPRQMEAVRTFAGLPEAGSLAAANKRVVNILRQAEGRGESFGNATPEGLKERQELELLAALRETAETARRLYDQGDFTGYLRTFARLKAPVDAFFDSVMVMADDPDLRRSRLALLRELRTEMNRIADISRLAA